MIVRAGTGWQYALADLSLILFMVTASALSQAGPGKAAPPPPPVEASTRAEPVAVWSAGSGAPPLGGWLAREGADPRLQVSIVVRYGAGARAAALDQALRLAEAGGARASAARVLVEPGEQAGASVVLAYDREPLPLLLARVERPLAR